MRHSRKNRNNNKKYGNNLLVRLYYRIQLLPYVQCTQTNGSTLYLNCFHIEFLGWFQDLVPIKIYHYRFALVEKGVKEKKNSVIFSLTTSSNTNCLDDLWDDVKCQNSARESLLHTFSLV